MVEKFKALIEDYKVTRNENEDFVWWYVQRVAPFITIAEWVYRKRKQK